MVTFIRERKQKWMEQFHGEKVVAEELKNGGGGYISYIATLCNKTSFP